MGCAYSAQMLDVPLATLKQPVAALDARNCEPHPITLVDRLSYSSYARKFYDAALPDNVRFHTMNETKLKIFASSRQWLLDIDHGAVANYERVKRNVHTIAVHPGKDTIGEPHFEVYAEYRIGSATDVRVTFRDVVSGQLCELTFEGNWFCRDAILWLDRGQTGERVAVAKVYVPSDDKRKGAPWARYCVDVAANMDTALVAIVCIALNNSERWHDDD